MWAVSLKHWIGRGGVQRVQPPPPAVYGRSNTPLPSPLPPPPPGGSLGSCTCAQEAISTKSRGRKRRGSGPQDHRNRSGTKECNAKTTRGSDTPTLAAAPQRYAGGRPRQAGTPGSAVQRHRAPPRVTFRRVAVSLRGPGQSPVLPFACCVGSLRSDGRCGRCSRRCRFRVRGAQRLAYPGLCWLWRDVPFVR